MKVNKIQLMNLRDRLEKTRRELLDSRFIYDFKIDRNEATRTDKKVQKLLTKMCWTIWNDIQKIETKIENTKK